MARTRAYPHLEQVQDRPVQQILRLLWDRVYADGDELDSLTTRMSTAEGDVAPVRTLNNSSRDHSELIQELFTCCQDGKRRLAALEKRMTTLEATVETEHPPSP